MIDAHRSPGTLYLRASEWIARRLESPEDGQGMVEYALILVLIAIVVIVILQVVGKQVNNVFSNISNGLSR
jgi:pilus assembly protein Flp/PilA